MEPNEARGYCVLSRQSESDAKNVRVDSQNEASNIQVFTDPAVFVAQQYEGGG